MLIVFTVAAAIVALAFVEHTLYTMTHWPCVAATVLRYRKDSGGEGTTYHPVYRFVTLEGITVTTISSWGSWRRPWERGARIRVRYWPSNPLHTEVECFSNKWGAPATIVALVAIAWLFRLGGLL